MKIKVRIFFFWVARGFALICYFTDLIKMNLRVDW
jgi:hypothetical protein